MTTPFIQPETLIPDLLKAAPRARAVLDVYGLRGCGGPLGPMESLAFFASAHDVPLPQLLVELKAACHEEGPAPVASPRLEDRIYRPFFKAGIAVVLTLGAAWGAYLLLEIALARSFAGAGLHEINAHGHAQIFGWVGLFVMGFAYQAFPRFKHTNLAHPRLAFASGALMGLGILVRSIGEPLAVSVSWLAPVVVAAAWVEVVAITLFAALILKTLKNSGKPWVYYDGYIVAALGWFVVQAVYEAFYLAATLAADGTELVALVAVWQGPLREMQIHGFAMMMILGVSQRLFHHFYGFAEPSARLSVVVLALLNVAIIGEVTGFILMQTMAHGWAALWYGASWLLAGGVAVLVWSWRLFAPPRESDRSLKFLRTAYVWLFVSLAMLLLLPVYQFSLERWNAGAQAAQTGFSHAYYGAIRHAITVGFISLMIVGVAAKVVPTLNGVDVRRLPALWLPFALINIGCALRVGGQVLTDWAPAAFPFAGVSGCLEVAGLAIWGVHLWRIMTGRIEAGPAIDSDVYQPGEPIRASHIVGQVLDHDPDLLGVFLSFGFKPLASSWLRQTLARRVTIAQACRLAGVDSEALLAHLNRDRAAHVAGHKISLPLLS
jgi:hypothetical protein